MNKELEEAIEFIKYYMKQYFYEDMAIEDDFKFEKAISIALNHIENSISKEEYNKIKEENEKLKKSNRIYINSIQNIAPILLEDYIEKEKVEEQIKELKDMKVEGEVFKTSVNFAIKILQELLEGK